MWNIPMLPPIEILHFSKYSFISTGELKEKTTYKHKN